MKGFVRKKIVSFGFILCICFVLAAGDMVNASETEPVYKIMVNRAANCVTVYEQVNGGELYIPVKAFVCSCGKEGKETPLGTFKTSDYYQWRLMVDGSYGRYAVRFNRGIMFHSVPYYTQDAADMEWEQFNLLGEAASLGCVRLACADAKWIYDNCGRNTEVVVYDDAENPGPLGKPVEVKLEEANVMKQWDPTDTEGENPWNSVRPTLNLISNEEGILRLPVGASLYDIYKAISLSDFIGNIWLGEYTINVFGNYDLNTAGVYQISVYGISAYGVRAEKNITLCVG